MKNQLTTLLKKNSLLLFEKKSFIIPIFLAIFLFQCKPIENQVLEIQKKPFEVSLDEAVELASKYDLTVTKDENAKNLKVAANSAVVKKETVTDENKNPLFHVLNYKEGGFIIVSADLRTVPVLAFSDKGSFETKEIPSGVKEWFDESKKKIKNIKKDNKDVDPIIQKAWKEYLSGELNIPTKKGGRVSNDCWQSYNFCNSYSSSAGPLLQTNWGQSGYSTHYLNSYPGANQCDKYNAGCGPVALAQIMRFYQKPNWFTYDGMPNNYSRFDCNATTPQQLELARLMAYCGSASGLNSSYGFWGTTNTFSWPSNIPDALSNYGYSGNGSSVSINYETVKNEVSAGHPVVLWGTSGWAGNFENYHIWICDGMTTHMFLSYNCATQSCNGWGATYLHMNWGWHGDWNGNYVPGNFSPGSTTFDTYLHMIYGIRP